MSTLKTVLAAVIVIATITLSAHPGSTQSSPGSTQSSEELKALRQELEAIKEGQGRLQKDVQEIKAILQGARAAAQPPQVQPQNVVLTLDGEPTKGDTSARVVLVEFTDYQCPFCGRYVHDAYAQIEAEYIKTGKLRYVIREFPLESIHPQAFKAAEAALCAGDQGKYWEMHDRLFANQRALAPDQLPRPPRFARISTTASRPASPAPPPSSSAWPTAAPSKSRASSRAPCPSPPSKKPSTPSSPRSSVPFRYGDCGGRGTAGAVLTGTGRPVARGPGRSSCLALSFATRSGYPARWMTVLNWVR